jgi:hypothetical protein
MAFTTEEALMDRRARHVRIRGKLATGALPCQPFPRVLGGPGDGQACDGCDGVVERTDLAMEGTDALGRAIRLHVECFRIWEEARDRSTTAVAPGDRLVPRRPAAAAVAGPSGGR